MPNSVGSASFNPRLVRYAVSLEELANFTRASRAELPSCARTRGRVEHARPPPEPRRGAAATRRRGPISAAPRDRLRRRDGVGAAAPRPAAAEPKSRRLGRGWRRPDRDVAAAGRRRIDVRVPRREGALRRGGGARRAPRAAHAPLRRAGRGIVLFFCRYAAAVQVRLGCQ